jgi:hypothetical protein
MIFALRAFLFILQRNACQYFINPKDALYLTEGYAVFSHHIQVQCIH